MSGLAGLSADARSKTIGQNFRCRAWVNFDGTGTVAIRASGNVSSITDNGNGHYTVNFTSNMQDGNYVAVINVPPHNYTSGSRQHFNHIEGSTDGSNYSTSQLVIKTGTVAEGTSQGTAADMQILSILIFR